MQFFNTLKSFSCSFFRLLAWRLQFRSSHLCIFISSLFSRYFWTAFKIPSAVSLSGENSWIYLSCVSHFRIPYCPLNCFRSLRSGGNTFNHRHVFVPLFSILPATRTAPLSKRYSSPVFLHLCRCPLNETTMFLWCRKAILSALIVVFQAREAPAGYFIFFRFQDVSYQILWDPQAQLYL